MTEETNDGTPEISEIGMLKQRADIMGVKYNPMIGVEKLKERIEAHQAQIDSSKAIEATPESAVALQHYDEIANAVVSRTKIEEESASSLEARRRMNVNQQANLLVRIRITCMNPAKSKMTGEVFSVGNSVIGFIKKYVPFNAPNGWHVPQVILTQIREKKFSTFYETEVNGKKRKQQRLTPEFAVEVLSPLTAEELKELAQRQMMASGESR